MSGNEGVFDEYILYNDNYAALMGVLSKYQVVLAMPGTESGVDLSEKIKFDLGIFSNNPDSILLRRNKFYMHQALKAKGLKVPPQIRSNSLDEIKEWINTEKDIVWPIVVKPLQSAASDGIRFCNTLAAVLDYAESLIGQNNLFGHPNDHILIQSYIDGQEFVVNTISWNGKHKITDVWLYHKRYVDGAGMVYDSQELLPLSRVEDNGMRAYVYAVLDALEIKYGPSHCEVMLAATGPVLVEVASRIQGGINTQTLDICLGKNQLDLTLDLYLNNVIFEEIDIPQTTIFKSVNWINLIATKSAIVRNLDQFIAEVKALPSYFSIYVPVIEDQLIPRTIDLITSPGVIFLVHEDGQQIQADYTKIRELESEIFV